MRVRILPSITLTSAFVFHSSAIVSMAWYYEAHAILVFKVPLAHVMTQQPSTQILDVLHLVQFTRIIISHHMIIR